MNVLVLNAGSSSCKYQLIDMQTETALCSGLVERIGAPAGKLTHKIAPGMDNENKVVMEQPFADHVAALETVMKLLTDPQQGVIKDKSEIYAIGHRVVQGGEAIKEPVKINEQIKNIIREQAPLSPLHNPANLAGIEVTEKLLPGVPSVGVFDTEFHQTMPAKAYLYPLPLELYEELKIRRYGFHGTSHRYVTKKAAEFLGKPLETLNVITCHLGNGCSMSAVQNGKCIDTTMGLTPLEGLMMGTRCGDVDPAIVPVLIEKKGLNVEQLNALLNNQSGLKGICGMNDMRDLHDAVAQGDPKAKLALDMFNYRIKKYIGAFYAVLGRVDALIFTAGIGENDEIVRAEVCADMEAFGIAINAVENDTRRSEPRNIAHKDAKLPVLVIPTNEELEIAQATVSALKG